MRLQAAVLVMILMVPGCLSSPEPEDPFFGEEIDGSDPENAVPAFSLTNYDGSLVNLSDYENQVVIVSFVYTRCPDVCPVVSSNLRWVADNLSEDYGTNFSILTITVDPWYDTQSVLTDYADSRNLSWPHLTGEVEVLEPIWTAFHVGLTTYEDNRTDEEKENGTAARHHPDYLVEHSTATIIIDRNHEQAVFWGDLDWVPELFVADVRALIEA